MTEVKFEIDVVKLLSIDPRFIMGKKSAGILMFKRTTGNTEVLLVHPGGPFWSKRDTGSWTIPKGEYTANENVEAAARREFLEETGVEATGKTVPLGTLRQVGGKLMTIFALEGDLDTALFKSNLFAIEWPPHSGQEQLFAEVDRIAWLSLADAKNKLIVGQRPFLDLLQQLVGIE